MDLYIKSLYPFLIGNLHIFLDEEIDTGSITIENFLGEGEIHIFGGGYTL
jgi:hypothetical protein